MENIIKRTLEADEGWMVRVPCPHCKWTVEYVTDMIRRSIEEQKPLKCGVCSEKIQIVSFDGTVIEYRKG